MAKETRAFEFYRSAKTYLLDHGYADELAWQERLDFESFTESDLLREASWVILCSGFREAVVRRHFDFISLCFCDWESAEIICKLSSHCRAAALTRFANKRKIEAIIETADYIRRTGFSEFKARILADPLDALKILPFIGSITAFHLAKNLGFSSAKPDRHLQRVTTNLSYSDVATLCSDISRLSGDSVQVVDLILWRFAEQKGPLQLAASSEGLDGFTWAASPATA